MPFLSTVRGSARVQGVVGIAFAVLLSAGGVRPAAAQAIDCGRLQQQIAAGGGGNRAAGAARKQSAELARTSAYAHQLGCDRQQFLFFGASPSPQCGPLNGRIAQMQANLGQLQAAGGGGGRDDLIARFNAYCRGGQQSASQQPPRQRGFFESLFGGGEDPRQAPPPADVSPGAPGDSADDGDGVDAHGGSQAVCVRTCDGGFFPMNMSSHHNQDTLNELCTALCPGTQAAVYTRNPNNEIKTAVSLDGTPYMDLPNALKFQKSFDATCTCQPAGKTWAEALAGAEAALGNQRKGDIMVTPEKAAEMSRPKMDSKTRASLIAAPTAPVQATASDAKPADQGADIMGPDGVTRHVRTVGPKL